MKATLCLSLLGCLCLLPHAAQAQRLQRADSTYLLDSLEVHAHYRHDRLNRLGVPNDKVPMTLSTLPQHILQERGIRELRSAMRFVPGVFVRKSYGVFNKLVVRGLDEPGIYIDGVRYQRSAGSRSFPFPALSDLDEVELLKGPASVLFGRSAIGGVLNIVHRHPSSEPSLRAELGYGSWAQRDLSLSGGGQLAPGLNIYAGGYYSDEEGWRSLQGRERSIYTSLDYSRGVHSLLLRLGLRDSRNRTDIGLAPVLDRTIYKESAQAKDAEVYLQPGQLLPDLKRSWNYSHQDYKGRSQAADASLRYSLQLGKHWQLTNYLACSAEDIDYFAGEYLRYPTSEDEGREQLKTPYYALSGEDKVYYDLDHLVASEDMTRFINRSYALQNQLELRGHFYTAGLKHNILLGHTLEWDKRANLEPVYPEDAPEGSTIKGSAYGQLIASRDPQSLGHYETKLVSASTAHTQTQGFYLSDVLELGTKLQLMGALRYDHYSLRSGTAPLDDRERVAWRQDTEEGSSRVGSIDYRVGLVYQPLRGLSVYGSVGSFYSPDRTLSIPKGVLFFDKHGHAITEKRGGHYFSPRSGRQWELGLKYQWEDKLTLLASGYFIRRENELQSFTTKQEGKTQRYRAELGATETKGLEAEISYQPLPQLQLAAGYGYTRAQVAEMPSSPLTKLAPKLSVGSELAFVPRHTFYSYGRYELQRGVLRGLSALYSLSYRGRMSYSSDLISGQPFTQLDLGLRYQWQRHWTLGLQLDNVLSTEGYAVEINGSQLVPEAPRHLRLSLSYQL